MHIRANFKKKLKSCSLIVKNVLIKNICDVYKLLKTLKIYYPIFGNLCQLWNLCNEERQILKNSIFDGLLIINYIFHKLSMLLANQILHILCIFIKSNVWHSWSLKILVIKRWFQFNFAKSLQGRHFVVDGPKKFKLLADISFGAALKILYYRVYCYFCIFANCPT